LLTRRQLALRSFWSASDAAASPVAALFIAGVCARLLGIAEYGLLVVALAIANLSAAIVPAIAMTTTRFVSQLRGAESAQGEAMARVVGASLLTVLLIDAVLIVLVTAFSEGLSHLLFGEAVAGRAGIRNVLILSVLVVSAQQLDGVFSAVLRGLEQFRAQALFEVATKALLIVAVVFAAFRFRNVEAVLLAYLAILCAAAAGRMLLVRAAMKPGAVFVMPDLADVRMLVSFGGWMWLTVVAGAAFFTVDRIIVGRLIGLAAAGEFALYSQLAQLCHFVPSSAFAFVFPLFSRLAGGGAGRSPELRRHYVNYRKLIIGAALLLAVLLLLFGQKLVGLLTGGHTVTVNATTYFLMVAGFSALSLNVAPYYLLLALGRSRLVSLTNTVSVLVMLILTFALVPVWGVLGAAVARFGYVLGTMTLLRPAARVLAISGS
jgi:O-antigen/teichoic acid export membrane protein